MKTWMRWAMGLYPPAWRDRYEAEFGALLEDLDPGWRVFWDVVRGGIAMRMNMWTFPKMMAACGLVGVILALAVAFQMENRYASYAVLQLTLSDGAKADAATVDQWLDRTRAQVLSRSSLSDIIVSSGHDLYKGERARKPLEEIVRSMATRDTQITRLQTRGLTGAIAVSFSYSDPDQARGVTNDLVARLISANLARGLSENRPPLNLRVLDPANPPRRVAPRRPAIMAAGLIAGLMLGVIAVTFHRQARSEPRA